MSTMEVRCGQIRYSQTVSCGLRKVSWRVTGAWRARTRERGGCCECCSCFDIVVFVADFTQIYRLPFRRSHRQAVLPTRVQRVGIQRAAISDDCVAVLEDNRCLMKCQCRTTHAISKHSSKQAIRRREQQPVGLPTANSSRDRSTSPARPSPGSTRLTQHCPTGMADRKSLD